MPRRVTIIDNSIQNRDGDTFIERYGYVQYRDRLPYPRVGPCEVLGCGIHKIYSDMLYGRHGKQEDPYGAFYIDEHIDQWTDDQIRRFLEIGLRWEKRKQERAGKSGLVFDHCHEHGWIRGIICASCNGKMRDVDLRMDYTQIHMLTFPDESTIEVEMPTPAYNRHWEKCPDCNKAGSWTALLGGIPTPVRIGRLA